MEQHRFKPGKVVIGLVAWLPAVLLCAACAATPPAADDSAAISKINARLDALQSQLLLNSKKLENIYICKQQLNNAISAVPCD